MNKFQKFLAKKKVLARLRELYLAVSLMDAYDADDYLASRNFRPDASAKDQRHHDEAMDWANRKLG